MGGCLSKKKPPRPATPNPGVICHITVTTRTRERRATPGSTPNDQPRLGRELPQRPTRELGGQVGRGPQIPRLELEVLRRFEDETWTDESTADDGQSSNYEYWLEGNYETGEEFDYSPVDHSNQLARTTTPGSESIASVSNRSSPRSNIGNSGSRSTSRPGHESHSNSSGSRTHLSSGFASVRSTPLPSRGRWSIGDKSLGPSPRPSSPASRSPAGSSYMSTPRSSPSLQEDGHIINPWWPRRVSNAPRRRVVDDNNRSSPRSSSSNQTFDSTSNGLTQRSSRQRQSGSGRSYRSSSRQTPEDNSNRSTPRSGPGPQTLKGNSNTSSPRSIPSLQTSRPSPRSVRMSTSFEGSSEISTPQSRLVTQEFADPRARIAFRGRSGSLSSADTSTSQALASALDASAVLSNVQRSLNRKGKETKSGPI